ncbi:MAG: hypothetical protein GY761_09795 [Hyphomicrobiales bacterium]|nr:hypothetical protein [Hyphomicrobiales bacterium]
MPVSNELMYAILAMDSYNRGYGEGIEHGKTSIGNAVFDQDDVSQEAIAAGFYAAAYTYNGETVISYRGTDDFTKDPLHGWGVGTGTANEPQGMLAAQFYQSVAKDEQTQEPHLFDSGIKLTGHSLGGGLSLDIANDWATGGGDFRASQLELAT